MALPHPTFPLPAPTSAVRPKKRKVAAATRATRQPSASTSTASAVRAPDGSGGRAAAPRQSWTATFANEDPIPQNGAKSTTGDADVRSDDEADPSASSCATRSESPPPIWIPPRTSSLPSESDVPQISSTTPTDARAARSSEPAQPTPTPHPRLIIRIPSLAARRAARHNSPGPGTKSAPPVPPAPAQKRARSPTPDSEEDDFAASFMRKRRVSAALL